MNKTSLAITLIIGASSATFCNYPMWTIPKTGTEYRCDFEDCPMRAEEYCDAYGVIEDEQCKVFCARNREIYEVYECVGDDQWERVSGEVDCENPGESGASTLAAGTALTALTALALL